ncbi:MAG: type I DNA topoisomerase [Magnetococcus sp. DMHC-6]
MNAIVIVESPAKAKTIQKFLGPGYQVIATYGHIRDLPKKKGSVDTENQFAMHYEISEDSTKHVTALTKATKGVESILLATDPDREGEAISWHVYEIFREKKLLEKISIKRVVFHEITRRAIQEALVNARDLDLNLINAQQARRALDYLVGFNLSPLLWKKVRMGLSAGRVQSVALRLVCERENEIRGFQVQEYWSVAVMVRKEESLVGKAKPKWKPFEARLTVADGKKLDKLSIANQESAERLVQALEKQPLFIHKLEKKQVSRVPAPPFITSTLQQEASRKLGFAAKKTMMVAQRLYEGVEVPTPEGTTESMGLITYMRTDSVTLAVEAVEVLRELVVSRYDKRFVPKTPRKYKSSAKNAQEAHEAIRPTDPRITPEQLKGVLPAEQWRLYELIWKRTVASQMASAVFDQVAATIAVGKNEPKTPMQLRANGSQIVFSGFLELYAEGRDEVSAQDRNEDEVDTMLPPLEEGEGVLGEQVIPRQHFTEPPPRFTEATLVKTLESYGIGRPSTYAPTMSTLQERGYVKLDARKFVPEDVGEVVNSYLTEHFSKYVDYHFTAHLEDDLDAVSRGEKSWIPLLEAFWKPFNLRISEKELSTSRADVTSQATDELCPKCGKEIVIKLGRYGRFKACTNYPECRFTENIKKEGEAEAVVVEPVLSEEKCDKCGAGMWIKEGRYGKYLACSAYPECRNIQPLAKPKDTGIACPECGQGTFLEKKSRRGKLFYSCSTYPKCKKALWNLPLNKPCPQCRAPFLTEKVTKKNGTEHLCVVEGCGFSQRVEV